MDSGPQGERGGMVKASLPLPEGEYRGICPFQRSKIQKPLYDMWPIPFHGFGIHTRVKEGSTAIPTSASGWWPASGCWSRTTRWTDSTSLGPGNTQTQMDFGGSQVASSGSSIFGAGSGGPQHLGAFESLSYCFPSLNEFTRSSLHQ